MGVGGIPVGLQRLGLVVFALAIGLGLAELGARWLLSSPPVVHVAEDPDRDSRLAGDAEPFIAEARESLYLQTAAGLRLRPNTIARIEKHPLSGRDVEVRTNSLGHRGVDLGAKTRERVLFLGDSITFGDWLPEDETFVKRVEALSLGSEVPLETLNAGTSGVGLANELAILLETGLSTEPDIVVVGFYLNDTAPSRGVRPIEPPSWLRSSVFVRHVLHLAAIAIPEKSPDEMTREEKGRRSQRSEWLREIRREFPAEEGNSRESEGAFNLLIQKRVSDWGSAWSRKAWVRLEAVFRELRRQADAHDFQLMIVAFPVRAQVDASFVHDHPQQWLAGIAQDLDVPLLDLLPLLRELQTATDEPIFHDHCHHTAFGNAQIGEWIYRFLEEHQR